MPDTPSIAVRTFGVLSYVLFLASVVLLGAAMSGMVEFDRAAPNSTLQALAVDISLIAFFGVVHSVMARASFKRVWTRLIPVAAERSAYVLVSAAQLLLLAWQWRKTPDVVWWSANAPWDFVLMAVAALGSVLAVSSTFHYGHGELFGLQQSLGLAPRPTKFSTPGLYRFVRHPMYFGVLLLLWATPRLTLDRAVLAIGLSAYLFIGLWFEERDLVATFGDAYRDYQRRVPMLVPFTRWR